MINILVSSWGDRGEGHEQLPPPPAHRPVFQSRFVSFSCFLVLDFSPGGSFSTSTFDLWISVPCISFTLSSYSLPFDLSLRLSVSRVFFFIARFATFHFNSPFLSCSVVAHPCPSVSSELIMTLGYHSRWPWINLLSGRKGHPRPPRDEIIYIMRIC